jgi:hypothetical protein
MSDPNSDALPLGDIPLRTILERLEKTITISSRDKKTPQVGIEPTTRWLTAICSTPELLEKIN